MSCRTLIVGTPRSGTSSLLRAFGASNGFKRYGEPWNRWLYEKVLPFPYEFEENCNVKTLIHTLPKEYINKPITEFYDHLFPLFDNIILLGRKNFKNQLESYTYQLHQELNTPTRNKVKWQHPYTVKGDLPTHLYEDEMHKMCNQLTYLSEHSGIPITWYEDIYVDDLTVLTNFVSKFKGIKDKKSFFKKLNPRNRLRKDKLSLL